MFTAFKPRFESVQTSDETESIMIFPAEINL